MKQAMISAYLRYYQARLGGVGLAGLVLIVCAVGFWFLQIAPTRQAVADLETRVAANHLAMQSVEPGAAPVVLTDEQRLLAYFDAFPTEEQTPQSLGNVFKSASQLGLILQTGEYTLTVVPGSRLKRYRVTLPVKGQWIQILGFASNVLRAVPSAALENASFKREKIDDGQVEAKLVFQFFVNTKP